MPPGTYRGGDHAKSSNVGDPASGANLMEDEMFKSMLAIAFVA